MRFPLYLPLLSTFLPGALCYDYTTTEPVTYEQGETGIILTSPHGGFLKPADIPDRPRYGCLQPDGSCVFNHDCTMAPTQTRECGAYSGKDLYTGELTSLIAAELAARGHAPYVVYNNLHRSKMDANRDRPLAAFGVPVASAAWDWYTAAIDDAKEKVGSGVLFDIHGVASHPEQWIEVGYRAPNKGDLNADIFPFDDSSIRSLLYSKCHAESMDMLCVENIIRGEDSFGEMLATRVRHLARVIPSVEVPKPGPGGKYYRGGWTMVRHGSRDGGHVDAIQIESPSKLRNEHASPEYAGHLAEAMIEFYMKYYAEE